MSDEEFRVFAALVVADGEATGDALRRFYRSLWGEASLPATLYVVLSRQRDCGYLTSEQEESDKRRRTYKITDDGMRAFQESLELRGGLVRVGELALKSYRVRVGG